jgi:hypothetical protein
VGFGVAGGAGFGVGAGVGAGVVGGGVGAGVGGGVEGGCGDGGNVVDASKHVASAGFLNKLSICLREQGLKTSDLAPKMGK